MLNKDKRNSARCSSYVLHNLQTLIAFKNRAQGFIHSLFCHSFNIQMGEILINVSRSNSPISCLGIQIQDATLQQIISVIHVGDVVIYKEQSLMIYTQAGCFEINPVECVNMNFHQLRMPLDNVVRCLTQLKQIKFCETTGFDWNDSTLINGWQSFKTGTVTAEKVEYLIGRGHGLTPSGDDFLLGYLFTLEMTRQNSANIKAWIKHYSKGNTTDISIAYFNALFAGYISELPLKLLISASNISQTIASIQHYGHTSGNDLLFGIYAGLKSKYLTRVGEDYESNNTKVVIA